MTRICLWRLVGPTGSRYAGMEQNDTAATVHGRGKAGSAGLAVDPDRVFMRALRSNKGCGHCKLWHRPRCLCGPIFSLMSYTGTIEPMHNALV